jgi:hypothetical protein
MVYNALGLLQHTVLLLLALWFRTTQLSAGPVNPATVKAHPAVVKFYSELEKGSLGGMSFVLVGSMQLHSRAEVSWRTSVFHGAH